jgi:hypothetical protein
MPKNPELHIGITFPDSFPDHLIEEYVNEVSIESLNLDIRKLPFGGPYACLEWAIPTFISVYILKPYFDGFLKEISKEHYGILKNWLKKVATDTRKIKITTIAASQSTEKLDHSDSQSKLFSIQAKTNDGLPLKFLFNEDLGSEEWNIAIEKALLLLNEHFTNGKSDELTIEIKNSNLERTIYARLRTDTIDWEFLDLKKIYLKQQNHVL